MVPNLVLPIDWLPPISNVNIKSEFKLPSKGPTCRPSILIRSLPDSHKASALTSFPTRLSVNPKLTGDDTGNPLIQQQDNLWAPQLTMLLALLTEQGPHSCPTNPLGAPQEDAWPQDGGMLKKEVHGSPMQSLSTEQVVACI